MNLIVAVAIILLNLYVAATKTNCQIRKIYLRHSSYNHWSVSTYYNRRKKTYLYLKENKKCIVLLGIE